MLQFTHTTLTKKIVTLVMLFSSLLLLHPHSLFCAPREVKIGAISMEGTYSFGWNIQTRLTKVAPLIAEAGSLNLDIVAVAEAYFTGDDGYAQYAQDLNDSVILDSMKVWAKRNHIYIVFQVNEAADEKIYNTAILLNREGEYLGKYRKVMLPPEESALEPGDSFPVFDTEFGKLGMLICWDGWFTNPAKTLVENGAEFIIIPTWCNKLPNLKTITAENGVPISYAVHLINCGDNGANVPSSIYNHHGDPVFEDHIVGKNKIAVGTVVLGNYKNLALHKPVQTSGADPEHAAANAVDGIYSTERDTPEENQTSWKASSWPQWIEIDLGQDYAVDRVSIAQFNTDDCEYTLEGKTSGGDYETIDSQFEKFETILEHGIQGSEIRSARFGQKKVRYVKLTVSSTNNDVAINEIKVFGYMETETGIGQDKSDSPDEFALLQNYPNPFNPLTQIRYSLAVDGTVKLVIYNAAGQEIKTLIHNEQQAGHHTSVWDGTNERGEMVSSGVYVYALQTDEQVQNRKMVLLR